MRKIVIFSILILASLLIPTGSFAEGKKQTESAAQKKSKPVVQKDKDVVMVSAENCAYAYIISGEIFVFMTATIGEDEVVMNVAVLDKDNKPAIIDITIYSRDGAEKKTERVSKTDPNGKALFQKIEKMTSDFVKKYNPKKLIENELKKATP